MQVTEIFLTLWGKYKANFAMVIVLAEKEEPYTLFAYPQF